MIIILVRRVFKSDLELEVLRYAVNATNAAHLELMRTVRPGQYEYHLERCVCIIYVHLNMYYINF
jgi:Xaa-Pro aminopeptidase